RLRPPGGDQLGEVRMQLAACPPDRLARALSLAAVLRVVLADDFVRPAVQKSVVRRRDAEGSRDDPERERRGDAVDEVELAGARTAERVIEQRYGDALDDGRTRSHCSGRERRVRDAAQSTMS